MECNEIEIIKKKFEEEYSQVSQIVEILNKLGKATLKELYSPLKVNDDDKSIYYKLIKLKYDYLKDSLEEVNKYSLEYFSTLAFKALFLGDEIIKLDDLDKKRKCFDIIFTVMKGEDHPNEKEMTAQLGKPEFNKIIDLISNKFGLGFLGFIALLILNNQKSPDIFLDFFFTILSYFFNFTINFSYSDLKDLSLEQILDGLTNNISIDSADYFELTFENNTISKKLISPDELEMIINQQNKKIEKSGKIFKSKNKKKKNKSYNKEKIENAINISTSPIKIKIKEEKELAQKELGKDLLKPKEEEIDKSNNLNNNNLNEQDALNQIRMENENIKKTLNDVLDMNEKILNEFNKMKKDNTELKNKIKNLKNKMKEKDRKNRKGISDLEVNQTKVAKDLNIIKSRGAIKALIDYCYKSSGLSRLESYEKKVNDIINIICHYKNNTKYEQEVVEMLIKLLATIKCQLDDGNKLAHPFDNTKPIIEQIIKIVNDKETDYSKLKERFNDSKASDTIEKIVYVREKYYNDPLTLQEEEKKAFDEIENMDSILLKVQKK